MTHSDLLNLLSLLDLDLFDLLNLFSLFDPDLLDFLDLLDLLTSFTFWPPDIPTSSGLRGCILIELALRGRVELER